MNYLLGLKWQLSLTQALSIKFQQGSRKTERLAKYKYWIFMPAADIFLIPYFWPIFANFQKEADCLRVNSLTDRDVKWLFFISWSTFRPLLPNPGQISKINAIVKFLLLIKRVYFSLLARYKKDFPTFCPSNKKLLQFILDMKLQRHYGRRK